MESVQDLMDYQSNLQNILFTQSIETLLYCKYHRVALLTPRAILKIYVYLNSDSARGCVTPNGCLAHILIFSLT